MATPVAPRTPTGAVARQRPPDIPSTYSGPVIQTATSARDRELEEKLNRQYYASRDGKWWRVIIRVITLGICCPKHHE